jgi:hypothetical protein
MDRKDPGNKLYARPDGRVVWDTWMRKFEPQIRAFEAQRDAVFADWSSVPAIEAQLDRVFGSVDATPLRALAVLKWHGTDALSTIDYVLASPLHARYRSFTELCVRMLKAIHAPAAIGRLLALLNQTAAREAIAEHARRWPVYMIQGLLDLKPNRQQPAAELVQQLLHENPSWVSAVEEACDEQQRQTLTRLLQRDATVTDASDDELPDILRHPPWRNRAALPLLPELEFKPTSTQARFHWDRCQGDLAPPSLHNFYYRDGVQSLRLDEKFAEVLAQAPDGAADWDHARKALWMFGVRGPALELAIRNQCVDATSFQALGHPNHYEAHLYLWHLPAPLAASVLQTIPLERLGYLSSYGRPIPKLMRWLQGLMLPSLDRFLPRISQHAIELYRCIEWDGLANHIAQGYCSNRWVRSAAFEWLCDYAETAARALIPTALGKPGVERDAARQAVRDLAAHGRAEAIARAATGYGTAAHEALQLLLQIAPEQVLPDRLPNLPKKLFLPGLPRLLLRDGGRAVPLARIPDVLMCLQLSRPDQAYPGLQSILDAVTDESMARFGRALFGWWQDQETPSKERWIFAVQGLIGNDETARVLTSAARQWRAALIRVRAYDAMEMLAQIGSDAALMHLQSLAAQTRYADLHARAQRMISDIAEARGLTLEELADRSVPDLGLDADGSLTLDFGPRCFSVHFNEVLLPFVKDQNGHRIKDLPKPNGRDDAVLAKAAVHSYKDLKKQARSLAGIQLRRLESAMCARRRWSMGEFRQLLMRHPLMSHLVRRLLWGVFAGGGDLLSAFRVAEDLTLADHQDQALQLADEAQIGIVHPVELPEALACDFGQLFADYEILQPIQQLGRQVYAIDADLESAHELPEWKGRQVTVASLLGLEQRGWNRRVGDGGMIHELVKPLGPELAMVICFSGEEGWFVGSPADPGQVHEIDRVVLVNEQSRQVSDRPRLDQMSAIQASEVQRDLHLMAWFTG